MRIGFDSSSWPGLWMLSFPPASFVSENPTRIFSSWRWTSPRHPRGRLSISKTPRSSSKSQKVWGFEAFFTRTTNPPAPNWLRLDCRLAKESPMKPADSNIRNCNLEDKSNIMKATQKLHDLGQSLWLDNITRDLLNSGTLKRYIGKLSVTGLTSNPTIFDHAIKSASYDVAIREGLEKGKSGESLFFDLALDDLTRAADLFRPIHDRTNGVDGWVSLEVSPLLAHDTVSTIAAAKELSGRAGRPNLFIKIPGTREGLPAIEEAIFAGVPVNVTLLFSHEQYLAAAQAYLRGVERRIASGLNPQVGSVASMFISRWDAAVAGKVPETLSNRLGIAVAGRIYKAYLELLSNPRWLRAYNAGARPQRLLWASTGTKDPKASDTLYIEALASPFTVNTMPEVTLKALAAHGEIGPIMAADGGDCEAVLDRFAQAGVNVDSVAARLQDEGAKSFVKSWMELLEVIASKGDTLKKTA